MGVVHTLAYLAPVVSLVLVAWRCDIPAPESDVQFSRALRILQPWQSRQRLSRCAAPYISDCELWEQRMASLSDPPPRLEGFTT